ncbi:hypothetical protein SAMN02927914_06600 [Mesorhizobium qingshengii]|uniref:Uncharacterized protein n=1 Tax=Mesorhizobium qingshengii TaxID=1165689 RepID=A0A1G5ZZ24_9HYPH|nr:hypothetical protein SAMN02927914_06600 [Mesorhizobium qingshengii]
MNQRDDNDWPKEGEGECLLNKFRNISYGFLVSMWEYRSVTLRIHVRWSYTGLTGFLKLS